MTTVEELEYWMRIILEKDETGEKYLNGPRQEEAVKMFNQIRGTVDTVDAEFEIIEPKQITNGE